MLLNLLVFAFAAIFGKVLLGFAAVWWLLPADGRCSGCDEETLLLRPPPPLGRVYRMFRVQLRWCPACAETHHARYGRRRSATSPAQERMLVQ